MVQRRAVRYVTNRHHNTSSVGSMIEDLNWKSLEDRRKIAKLTMMYKVYVQVSFKESYSFVTDVPYVIIPF
jgi:hypothetical protein